MTNTRFGGKRGAVVVVVCHEIHPNSVKINTSMIMLRERQIRGLVVVVVVVVCQGS